MNEVQEIQMYEALTKDARRVNVHNEKDFDDCLENIETAYRTDYISDEQVRYITRLLLSR